LYQAVLLNHKPRGCESRGKVVIQCIEIDADCFGMPEALEQARWVGPMLVFLSHLVITVPARYSNTSALARCNNARAQ
jgi:hypothetical protein